MPGMTRRSLLSALGLAGASLVVPGFGGRRARAAGVTAPRRLVVFYTLHGTVYDNWKMRPSGQPDTTDWEADLTGVAAASWSPILAPLYDLRDRLLVLDGLSMVTAEGDVMSNQHSRGQAHSLTCVPVVPSGNDVVGGGPSVDQVIAGAIRDPDRFASLELSVRPAPSVIYQAANQRLPTETNPRAAFDRLFPGATSGGPPTADDRVRAAQPSVLDFVAAEYDRVLGQVGSADRARLSDHRDLIRDLERRIAALASISCDHGDAPAPIYDSITHYAESADSMSHLVAAALACDLTRVVTIQMGEMSNAMIGAGPGSVHNDFAHNDDTTGKDEMTAYHSLHATQFASLVQLLASVPDVDGGSVLDNTAVVWCGELSSGRHSFLRWPVVIAGGAGGAFSTGRYVHWAPSVPTPNEHPTWSGVEPVIGPPHNRMWTSVARAVGMDVDSFGSTEIETIDGTTIDLTGPLDRI